MTVYTLYSKKLKLPRSCFKWETQKITKMFLIAGFMTLTLQYKRRLYS